MDVLALILAFVALAVFLLEASERRRTAAVTFRVPLALALLTGALICQFTTVTDKLVNW